MSRSPYSAPREAAGRGMPLRNATPLVRETGHRVVTLVVIGSHQGLSNVYLCSWVSGDILTYHTFSCMIQQLSCTEDQ